GLVRGRSHGRRGAWTSAAGGGRVGGAALCVREAGLEHRLDRLGAFQKRRQIATQIGPPQEQESKTRVHFRADRPLPTSVGLLSRQQHRRSPFIPIFLADGGQV